MELKAKVAVEEKYRTDNTYIRYELARYVHCSTWKQVDLFLKTKTLKIYDYATLLGSVVLVDVVEVFSCWFWFEAQPEQTTINAKKQKQQQAKKGEIKMKYEKRLILRMQKRKKKSEKYMKLTKKHG